MEETQHRTLELPSPQNQEPPSLPSSFVVYMDSSVWLQCWEMGTGPDPLSRLPACLLCVQLSRRSREVCFRTLSNLQPWKWRCGTVQSVVEDHTERMRTGKHTRLAPKPRMVVL